MTPIAQALATPLNAPTNIVIESQSLATALQAFSEQSGLQVGFESQLAKGIQTQGTKGTQTAAQALTSLLKGTGLEYRFINDQTVIVTEQGAPQTTAQALDADGAKEVKKTSSNSFRLAQTTRGSAGSSLSVEQENGSESALEKQRIYLDEVVVTGTRIAGSAASIANPRITVSATALLQSGQFSVADKLVEYPVLQDSLTGERTAGGQNGVAGTGLDLLSLRNLGASRTLVLVDGRRHVASLQGSQAVDINTIPSDLIERVDVMTGGASAIYGADGVTGVVNFVMKKDFEGLSTRLQSGISDRGDAQRQLFAVTAGKNFLGGRANFALAYEYGREHSLFTRDRRARTGSNATQFVPNPADPAVASGTGEPNGIPDQVPLRDVRLNDIAAAGAIDTDFDGVPDYIVTASGALAPFDPGSPIPEGYQQGGSGSVLADYVSGLLPDVTRHNVNAFGHIDLSPALTLFAEGKFVNTESFSTSTPTFDYFLLIPADNAYLPATLRADADENGGVLLNRSNFDLGRRGETVLRDTVRTVAGARGEVGSHAAYEASYVFGQTSITDRLVGNQYNDRFLAAIDAVRDPSGQITCRVNLDASWTPDQPFRARRALAPRTFQPGQCVPLNLFGENQASGAALNFINAPSVNHARLRQHVVSASLTGDLGALITLPGGAPAFAAGAEYRKEESRFDPDAAVAARLTYANALTRTAGSFDVKEVFGELSAPLLSDVPLVHRLELGGAIRLSDYSTAGRTTSWKTDGTYSPVAGLSFNSTYSTAVRAPNISELYAGSSQVLGLIPDPCNANQLGNGTSSRAENCRALLASLGVADPSTYNNSRVSPIAGLSGGNANLEAERAKTWTAGVLLEPPALPGLSLRADWYDIDLRNAINTVTFQDVANLCVDSPTLSNPFCAAVTRQQGNGPGVQAGNITTFTLAPQNVSHFQTSGLDLLLGYEFIATRLGEFSIQLLGNYRDRLEFVGLPGGPVINRRAEIYAPEYSANGDLTWSLGAVTLNYGIQWFDRTLRDTNQALQSNPEEFASSYTYMKSKWLHNLYVAVKIKSGFEFFGGVNNLLDVQPDLASMNYPTSPVGRYLYAGARLKVPSL